jgi:hypothetical protein
MKRSTILSASLTAGAMLSLGPAMGVAAAAPQSSSPPTPGSQSSSPARLSLNQDSGAPGSTVTARLAGCLTGQRGITAPGVFHKTHTGGAAGALLVDYTVSKDAKPGTYTIHATCAGTKLQASYTVGEPEPGGHSLSLQPASGPAGAHTTAKLTCLTSHEITDVPSVFHQTHAHGAAGTDYYDYTVSTDAKPGHYTIHATCGDKQLQATYTVTAASGATGSSPHGGSSTPSANTTGSSSGTTGSPSNGGNAQVSKVPEGSVNTGGGATAGVEQPWLLGIGGAAILTGSGAAAAAGTRLRKQ